MDIVAIDEMGAWEMPAQRNAAPKEDIMQPRSCATFLISLLLFCPPGAYADDVSQGKDFFLANCLGCHAFTCNKEGPRLGGLFGRKAASVEGYGYYSQDLKNSGIVWTEQTLGDFFKDPGKITPNGVMAGFGKIEDAVQRRQLIAFLATEDPTMNFCPQE